MRTPFGWWTLSWRISLPAVFACCVLWSVPAAALAAAEQTPSTPVLSAPASAAPTSMPRHGTTRSDGVSIRKRVLALVAIGCLAGMIVGWVSGGPRETRFRLLNKPKKTMRPPVLVPRTPAPRLVPGDSLNATRARSVRAPMARQTPLGATGSGMIDYIAAFADSGEASGGSRVDYLLVSDESAEESLDSPGAADGSTRDTA